MKPIVIHKNVKPSLSGTYFQILKGLMPRKIAQQHFSLREATAKTVKLLWEISSGVTPVIKAHYNVERIKLENSCSQFIYKNDWDKKRLVFYIHGGAYFGGTLADSRRKSIRYAVRTKSGLYVSNYRVSAVAPFPAGLNDVIEGYKKMLGKINEDTKIIIIGDSAGGGMAVALVRHLIMNNIRIADKIIINSPWTDLNCVGKSYYVNAEKDMVLHKKFLTACARYYVKDKSMLKNEMVSPVYADFTDFPPMIINVGTNEILLSDSIRLATQSALYGVDVKLNIWHNMFHMFHFYEGIFPEATYVCEDIYNEILNGHA